MADADFERVEARWQTEGSSFRELTDIRATLLATQGMGFDLSDVDQGIKNKIVDLCEVGELRDWNAVSEADVLNNMKCLVALRKHLVESNFPHTFELASLEALINSTVQYLHWE